MPITMIETGVCQIHVGQRELKLNMEDGGDRPVLSIRESGEDGKEKVTLCHEIKIGPVRLVYRPDAPLSCGARIWLEAPSELVEIVR